MMNVYEKLQTARVRLQEAKLKKSGKNTFAKYEYYELGDFMPEINRVFAELKLMGQVSFNNDAAYLKIIDTDKPDEYIVFESPMSEANLKGCHPVQNLGAVQTYLRRYLYTTALEIVEADALDKTTGREDKPDKRATQGQIKQVFALSQTKGINTEDLKKLMFEVTGKSQSGDMTPADAAKLINFMDKKLPGQEATDDVE